MGKPIYFVKVTVIKYKVTEKYNRQSLKEVIRNSVFTPSIYLSPEQLNASDIDFKYIIRKAFNVSVGTNIEEFRKKYKIVEIEKIKQVGNALV